MKILGIECSCDDTSISIVDSSKTIIANEVLSQNNIHKKFDGIVPELAARNHVLFIDRILEKILIEKKLDMKHINLISATAGPGLIGGLLVGLSFAKTLAQFNNIPFIGVNHLEGHALTTRLTNNTEFPFLLLLISGGHTSFYFVSDSNEYKFLGGTLDDALGEAFDKVAKLLDLSFPGGPLLEELAKTGKSSLVDLPRPLIKKSTLNMSFSGLKTAVINKTKDKGYNNKFYSADIAASFQEAVSDILCSKITLAMKFCDDRLTPFRNVVIAGGVASNKYLRLKISEIVKKNRKNICFPPPNMCTDNGAMIAWAGYELYRKGIRSELNLRARPRWPLEEVRNIK